MKTTTRKPWRMARPGVRVYPSGREVCGSSTAGREEYRKLRELCWDRDRGICCLCCRFVSLDQATLEHLNGRGLGGGKRDDRPSACAVACWAGNNAKGSISYKIYMQKPLEERVRLCQGR